MPSRFRVPLVVMLFIWLSMRGDVSACIWLRGTTIEGWYGDRPGTTGAKQLVTDSNGSPEGRLAAILAAYSESNEEAAALSDLAVEKLLRGDTKAAVQDLEAVEKAHPGHYYTAANLGTAYELSGDDEKALQWILEGIRRDPQAHMRTEWLHARILETKLKLKSDPSWLEHNSISGIDFGKVKKSGYRHSTLQGELNGEELHKSLWTQLSVRMLFVKPEDPIVAQLLYELALVEAQTKFLEEAKEYLQLAEIYGLSQKMTKPLIRKWNLITGWSLFMQAAFYIAMALGALWLIRKIRRAMGSQP